MPPKKQSHNKRKRRKSNPNVSSEKPSKQTKSNRPRDYLNVNKPTNIDKNTTTTMNTSTYVPSMINTNNMNMNAMNIPVPNFYSPSVQSGGNVQYTNMPTPVQMQNLSQTSPMNGFCNVPFTPQGQMIQPVCNSTMNQQTDSLKIDNLVNKVDLLFSKLSLLDSLNEKINKFQSTMNTLIQNVENVTKRVSDVENSLDFINENYEKGRKDNEDIKSEMEEIRQDNRELNGHLYQLTNDMRDLRERHIDLQTRSMRENLIFTGIPEKREGEESDETGGIIKEFMTNVLKLEKPVDFVRAHRFGKRGDKDRPIVCRFKTFNDRETVRKNASQLKGSNYGISEQFPKEINDRRKELWPYYKEARKNDKKAHFKRDKLFIDGRRFFKPARDQKGQRDDNENDRGLERERYEQQGARPKVRNNVGEMEETRYF